MGNQLRNLVLKGESEILEFKENFNDVAIESIVAFANTKGGEVLIGVSNQGEIKGVQIGKETIQKWLNEIKVKTQPSIIPSFQIYNDELKTVIGIQVQEFPVKPLSSKGRYYKRIGNSNHQLSPIEITDLNLKSLQLSWDAYWMTGKSIVDLDVLKIEKFIQRVNTSGRFRLTGEWKKDLEKLKLINENQITNAAWLLFANDTTSYNVHVGRFKTPSLIIDDKMLNGTLFEVVEEVMNYLLSHIKVAFEITGKTTQRTEIFEYPLPALRELVLNAIIHRDFLSPIDIQIKIFDNSISFYNPGTLFGNLTVEQLKKDNYAANTRNKLIAEAFYLTGDIEKYGSGFIRIRDEVQKYPSMSFDFENIANGFLIQLSYQQQKVSEEVVDKVVDKLTNNQLEILKLMSKNATISAREISQNLGISHRKTQSNIAILKEKERIKRIGASKGGYWQIVD